MSRAYTPVPGGVGGADDCDADAEHREGSGCAARAGGVSRCWRVALTGGAASGKSAVAAELERLGAFVSRSDEVGRAMMQPGEAVFDAIAAHFGAGVVRADGTLDRGGAGAAGVPGRARW